MLRENNDQYILAHGGYKHHIAKIYREKDTSNPHAIGIARTRCWRYYRPNEYSVADEEIQEEEICLSCRQRNSLESDWLE